MEEWNHDSRRPELKQTLLTCVSLCPQWMKGQRCLCGSWLPQPASASFSSLLSSWSSSAGTANLHCGSEVVVMGWKWCGDDGGGSGGDEGGSGGDGGGSGMVMMGVEVVVMGVEVEW